MHLTTEMQRSAIRGQWIECGACGKQFWANDAAGFAQHVRERRQAEVDGQVVPQTDILAFHLTEAMSLMLIGRGRDKEQWRHLMLVIENRQYLEKRQLQPLADALRDLADRCNRYADLLLGDEPVAALEART